ncbi:MAG: A/G-specific adenine glycosylase [Candidatus Paceibacterota bacterium]
MKPAEFQQLVWDFYDSNGRHDLPWRRTEDPYAIYISEMMLQQTQAPRVVPKYNAWLKKFPDFESLARAPKNEVLLGWQGLGYNRRALYVKGACEMVAGKYNGQLPDTEEDLLSLPGVGPYTAGALQAFVYQQPVVFVETNIRTVFIHHFLPNAENVSDDDIKELVAETLPNKNIKEWYWALMDYGAHLKSTVGNINNQSQSYQKQSKFVGSNRQLRAELTRFVLKHEPVKEADIQQEFSELIAENERMQSVERNLKQLEKEGFLTHSNGQYKTSD